MSLNNLQHSEQSESVSNTCLVETDDSNITLDSPDMCEDDIQNEENDVESDDERVALANLKLDNRRDLPKDTPSIEIAVLRYDGDECDKGRMPTKIELTLDNHNKVLVMMSWLVPSCFAIFDL
nr:hypothetical protein [Tanacetum cinerariifolium]